MTIDVYLAPASGPCRAVLMTAKYLGVDVNQKMVDLMTGEQLKPEYLKVSLLALGSYGIGIFKNILLEFFDIGEQKIKMDEYEFETVFDCLEMTKDIPHSKKENN
ncbi:UNVERIFIED_CONTAM: Glutathione S-transferase 1-1 [Trichonephila clavipes]